MIGFDTLFLSSTDTTIGFLSRSPAILDRAKKRLPGKKYILALPSLSELKRRTRVPLSQRRRVRRARRLTFVLPDGRSYRIIRDPLHLLLLERTGPIYTTSANLSSEAYDPAYALSVADIVVEPLRERHPPSRILRFGKRRVKKLR